MMMVDEGTFCTSFGASWLNWGLLSFLELCYGVKILFDVVTVASFLYCLCDEWETYIIWVNYG